MIWHPRFGKIQFWERRPCEVIALATIFCFSDRVEKPTEVEIAEWITGAIFDHPLLVGVALDKHSSRYDLGQIAERVRAKKMRFVGVRPLRLDARSKYDIVRSCDKELPVGSFLFGPHNTTILR